jgi:hypothetical protein
MQLDVPRELQRRRRFFYEMLPPRRRRTRGSGDVISTSRAKWPFARDPHDLRRMTVHKDLAPRTATEDPRRRRTNSGIPR